MLGLALGQGYVALHFAGFPMQVQGHQGVAFLLNLADQALDFLLVHQQFLGPDLVRADVGRGGVEGLDLKADEEQLTAADHHIAVGELYLALTQGFDFPALQHQARFKTLFKKIVVRRLFVIGDAGSGIGFLGH